MKKVCFFLLTILIACSMRGQDITGQWNGLLTYQGIKLRLVFHISKTGSDYTATMDSPDQGAIGIPASTVVFDNSSLRIEVANAGILYTGKLSENKFNGSFKQGELSVPMNLSREKIEKQILPRPQDPVKPYPYYSEAVHFENGKDKITLAGTLTLPQKDGVYPAVVLITGSGPQNRDEELLGHRPFLVLSDYLTRKGIAVLRFDDRGTAESQGNFSTATTADFAIDVEAAVSYLLTRKEINNKQIGLIGHSEGGIIAPMVAVSSKEIRFIVLLAGTGIPGDQLLLLQLEAIEKTAGLSDSALRAVKVFNRGAYDIVKKSANDQQLKTDLANYYKQTVKNSSMNRKPAGQEENKQISQFVSLYSNPWIQYFIKYDPSIILEKVKCPVLALDGGKDTQVPAEINLNAIKIALEKGGNTNITIKEFPNLNHLFQECKTGSPDEYASIEQTFSPIALTAISSWIAQQIK